MRSDNALTRKPNVDPTLAGRLVALIEAYLRHVGPTRLRLALTSSAALILSRSGKLSVSTKQVHDDTAAKVPLTGLPAIGSLASTMDAFSSMEPTEATQSAAAEIFEAMIPSTAETATREAWHLIAAQLTSDADFAPVTRPGPTALPMRWATWWRLFSLPIGVLYGIAGGMTLLLGAGLSSPAAAMLGIVTLCATAAQAYVVVGLGRRYLWAWRLNWIPVVGAYITMIVTQAIERPGLEGQLRAFFAAVAGVFLWLWPNYRYWSRRKSLFSDNSTVKLPQQWIWAPVTAWAIAIISVLAALATPFIQSRNANSTANVCPANQRYVAEGHRCEWISTSQPVAVAAEPALDDAWTTAIKEFSSDPLNNWIIANDGRVSEFNRLTVLVLAANPGASYPDILQEARRLLVASPQFGPPVLVQPPPSPEPRKPQCEYKAVMSDDEIALCKNGG